MGGVLVELWDWRLVFLVNLPIGLLVWRLSARHLVESRAPGRRAWPDLTSALLLALAVGALTFAIVQTETWGLISPGVLGPSLSPPPVSVPSCVARGGTPRRWSTSRLGAALRHHKRPNAHRRDRLLRGRACESPLPHGGVAILAARGGSRNYAGAVRGRGCGAPRGALGRRAGCASLLLVGSLVWAAGPLYMALRAGADPAFLEVYLPAALLTALGVASPFRWSATRPSRTLPAGASRSQPGSTPASASSVRQSG